MHKSAADDKEQMNLCGRDRSGNRSGMRIRVSVRVSAEGKYSLNSFALTLALTLNPNDGRARC
jgi:hypothetical protein